jgi:hypothetical protein
VNTDTELAEAGKAAAAEGLRLFHLDVVDPWPVDLLPPPTGNLARLRAHTRAVESRIIIDGIFEAAGWGADTPYPGNRRGREWCGFFAAACWRAAGMDPKWLAPFFASTLRLGSWVRYRDWNKYKNPAPPTGAPRRLVAKLDRESSVDSLPFAVREGDIVIVGDGSPAEGEHITIALGGVTSRRTILTVSGNGGGNGPDGKSREGVVLREYAIGGTGRIVLWVYRPAPSDLEPVLT